MKILTAHDVQGNIHHVVVSPADAPVASVTTEAAGLLVSEVEVPEVISGVNLSDPEDRQQLAKVVLHLQDFRVEVGAKAKLVRK